MSTGRTALESLEKTTERDFQANKTVLGFDEYLAVLGENPERQLRATAHYCADMMDHFGKEPVIGDSGDSGTAPVFRFKIFDLFQFYFNF